jgi:hypothetical protein
MLAQFGMIFYFKIINVYSIYPLHNTNKQVVKWLGGGSLFFVTWF